MTRWLALCAALAVSAGTNVPEPLLKGYLGGSGITLDGAGDIYLVSAFAD